MRRDIPVWIERAIDKAEKGHTIYVEDAEVCRVGATLRNVR
jgi:hypothetical protein